MIAVVLATLVIIPQPELNVVRRLILTMKPGQERPDVQQWGESYVAGDGRVFLRLREGVSWTLAASQLAPLVEGTVHWFQLCPPHRQRTGWLQWCRLGLHGPFG